MNNTADAGSRGRKFRRNGLIICNAILILSAIFFTFTYSTYMRNEQRNTRQDAFVSAVESMKQISRNYVATEERYVADWAAYINARHMTIDEALDFIRTTNTQGEKPAHIVDMDTFEARSTYAKNGSDNVDCYRKMADEQLDFYKLFISNMRKMFDGATDVSILGKYRVNESKTTVVSVGTRVTLWHEDGAGKKDYLLLRVIPIEKMRSIWIFPLEYNDAEVSLITNTGSYVIPSASMKSETFLDYIRGYNFTDNYNQVNELKDQLQNTDRGLLNYKNSRGEDCLWYYSSFGDDLGLDILGYIKASSLEPASSNMLLVFVICGVLVLLMAMDGAYLMSINRRLRETAALAERASDAKKQFLSSMSHDIRTPMNAVLGMTDIARRNVSDPECVTDCLNKVTIAGNHLLTLINDILDISKVESGRMRLNPSSFSLERSIASIEDMIRPQLFEKHIEYSGTYTDISCKYIIGDELRVNQVLINLLTNSIKYTKPGGKVSLTLREERIPGNDNMIRLIFVVEDNGIGMSDEFQKTMYETFSRATNSQINKIQGSGLGLAIVRQMVDLMKGTISCDSKPGVGTRFTVTLEFPVAETPVETSGDSENGNVDISGMSVLVAEDNDLNWEIIATMLEEYGVKCFRSANGQECIDMLTGSKDGTYDVILMDIQMPIMNGREATKVIRQNEREYVRSIPIVAMTADAFAEDVQACLDCGMDGHISKPVNIQRVLQFLNKVKDNKIHNN